MSNYDYDLTFDDPADAVDAALAPEAANTLAAAALAGSVGPAPEIEPPADTHVSLPGGLLLGDGTLLTTAEVRELTGEHEETLAKAQGHPARLMSALLRCGVVSIGDEPATPARLKALSIGDREALILGIRRATFGGEIEFEGFPCPHCGDVLDLSIPLDQIPVRKLEDPRKTEYEIPLRKGGTAFVRIPTGADQEAALENMNLSVAEQNTVLLTGIVTRLVAADGTSVLVKGRTSLIKGLGIADRKAIVQWCANVQPGPMYDKVSFVHEACDKEVPLFLTVGDLFRFI